MSALCFLALFCAHGWAWTNVTLLIYLDMSDSMAGDREKLALMADAITDNLKTRCSSYEVAVSNITYADINAGGELITTGGGPAFITESTPNGKAILAKRINHDNAQASLDGDPTYLAGTHERTYSSAIETIGSHLSQSPSGFGQSGTVGILVLSDAAPYFELMSPKPASDQISKEIGGLSWMFGALSASSSCMDFPYGPDSIKQSQSHNKLSWLKDFSLMNSGYAWDMCSYSGESKEDANARFTQSVKDFMLMLMEKAECQVMM